MRFTISIVCHVALSQAKACLASLVASTQPFRLILTANGNAAVAAFFAEFQAAYPQFETKVIVNATNEGYIEPQKKAFEMCETEFWVMLNDDTILPPDWLEKLAAPFAQFPAAALSAPKGGCQSILQTFHGTIGRNFEYLNGACLCCNTEIMRKHGLFDPNLKFAYGDDSDLSLRMRELGYTLHYADFILRHEVGATSKHIKEVRAFVEANHMYLRRRWGHYLVHRKMDYPILIRRAAAWGDVLLVTPIIRALKKEKPLSPILVETMCADVLRGNPLLARADRKIIRTPDMKIINLDGCYENTPNRHIVASYAERAGVTPENYRTDLFTVPADAAAAEKLMPGDGWISIHCGPSTWNGKDWPTERFVELSKWLRAAGKKVVLVGAPGRDVPHDADGRGKFTVQGTAEIIRRSFLFIGIDSLPFHIAESVNTAAIGLFGVTDPAFISTRPELTVAVCGTTPSFGLRHRVVGKTSVEDGGAAMHSISVDMVLDTAMERLERLATT